MPKVYANQYKTCRNNAGFTQIRAAKLLNVSERSLSGYESGRTRVPDDVMLAMVDLYKSPMLIWWHFQEMCKHGKILPEIIMPQTHGDMVFQLVLAEDELSPAVHSIKRVLSNGSISPEEWGLLKSNVAVLKKIIGYVLAVVTYAEQLKVAG